MLPARSFRQDVRGGLRSWLAQLGYHTQPAIVRGGDDGSRTHDLGNANAAL